MNKMLTLKEKIIKYDKNNMKKKIPFIPLTMDKMFKGIFKDDLDLLKDFILSQIDLDVDRDNCNISLLDSELTKYRYNEYQKTVDILVKLNNNIYINIEINREYYRDVANRNFLFGNKIQTMMFKKGENINNLWKKRFIQINLNARERYNNKDIPINGIDIAVLYGLKSKIIYNRNSKFLIKYLDYYRYLYYNVGKELTRSELWLVLLTSKSYEELYNISSKIMDNEKRERLLRRVINMNNDEVMFEDWEYEYMNEIVKRDTEENIRNDVKEEFQKN